MALRHLLFSPIGKKLGMALSGLVLYGFLVGHLAGNLLLFKGDRGNSYNEYSEFLSQHPLLIPVELGLLTLFLLHIYLSLSVTRDNLRARTVDYQVNQAVGGRSWASYTMLYSGLLILVFVVIHLINFKYADHSTTTLYNLVVDFLRTPLYAGWYLFAMVILGFHLWHSLQSAFQTLGFDGQRFRVIGAVLSVALAGGFGLIPLWAYLK